MLYRVCISVSWETAYIFPAFFELGNNQKNWKSVITTKVEAANTDHVFFEHDYAIYAFFKCDFKDCSK